MLICSQQIYVEAFFLCFIHHYYDFNSSSQHDKGKKPTKFLSLNVVSIVDFFSGSDGAMKFESMPLSAKTRYSLKLAKLEIATEIQAASIPHALAGR